MGTGRGNLPAPPPSPRRWGPILTAAPAPRAPRATAPGGPAGCSCSWRSSRWRRRRGPGATASGGADPARLPAAEAGIEAQVGGGRAGGGARRQLHSKDGRSRPARILPATTTQPAPLPLRRGAPPEVGALAPSLTWPRSLRARSALARDANERPPRRSSAAAEANPRKNRTALLAYRLLCLSGVARRRDGEILHGRRTP